MLGTRKKLAGAFLISCLGIGTSLGSNKSFAASNEQLTIAISQEFDSLNPLISSMSASSYILGAVNRKLVIADKNWNWVCTLCQQLPSLENGLAKITKNDKGEVLEVTWEIPASASWNDGTPVVAKDFQLAWEIGQATNVMIASKELYERVSSIKLDPKNARKFTTVFKEPRYDFYQLIWDPLPSKLEGPVWEKTKDQTGAYEKQTLYTTAPNTKGLYNGPFGIAEVKLGSHVILTPNPHFGGQAPAIKKIVIKLIPNTQTLEASLLSGTIDLVSELGMTFDQALAFDKRLQRDRALASKYKVHFKQGLIYEHIDFNLDNPILKDKQVRQALIYGLDREKLSTALFEGKQPKALSNIHPLDPYYSDKVNAYDYDAKKAAALLDAAGWKLGADGYRYKNGEKLELNIMTTAGNKTRELVEQYIQAEYKKIGAALSIKNEPARVFFGETTAKRNFPSLAMYAWVSAPDSPPRTTLHSSEIPTKANGWSGQNYAGFSNAKMDQLLDAVFLEFDEDKRKAIMAEVQKIYTDEAPVIPLYLRSEIAIVPTNLYGYSNTGHQFYSTHHIEQWTFDRVVATK